MKFIKLITLPLLFLFTLNNMIAQENSCSFSESKEDYYNKNPEARKEADDFRKSSKVKWKSKGKLQRNSAGKYIIPVVFHIYGNQNEFTNSSNGDVYPVNDEIVKEAVAEINRNYKGGNNPINSRFQNLEGRMDTEFRLAQIDPDGNSTTGIIYHEFQKGFAFNGTTDSEIVRYAWDNYKYMNVHIQLIIKGNERNSGTAWLPSTGMSDEGVARVVYNGRYLQNFGGGRASTLTHEFGHYLGLEHTFHGGCHKANLEQRGELFSDHGDGVQDTPPTPIVSLDVCDENSEERNCNNDYINIQNHMSYNAYCEGMFTKGQVDRMAYYLDNNRSRSALWQEGNLIATGVKNIQTQKRIIFTYQEINDGKTDKYSYFVEHFDNDGKILNKKKIKADGVKFAKVGELRNGVDYTVSGVPAGLTAKVVTIDDERAEIYLEGRTINHEGANTTRFTLTFLNPSIVGGVNQLAHKTGSYAIKYLSTYGVYYETFDKQVQTGYTTSNDLGPAVTNFRSLALGGKIAIDLKNYDGNQLVLGTKETKMEVLCNDNSRNVKKLNEGVTITANSNGSWVGKEATIPPVISNNDYTAWRGKTAYIAMRVPTLNNDYLYGWLLTAVRTDGTYVKILGYGINEKPGEAMVTKVTKPMAVYDNDRFLESVANDGSMENEINVELKNASFAKIGKLSANTHYTIKRVPGGLPSGLTFEVTVLDAKHARLKMLGKTAYNGRPEKLGWEYIDNMEFAFTNAAFTSNNATSIIGSKRKLNMEFIGQNFKRKFEDQLYYDKTKGDLGEGFSIISSHQNMDRLLNGFNFSNYLAHNSPGGIAGVKFLSYRKDAIANDNYELTPLEFGTMIGPNSKWKKGREYDLGRGQHLIYSDTYQAWKGKRKFVGIRFQRSGRMHYGWIEVEVNSSGRAYQFISCGVGGTPNQPIAAGTDSSEGIVNPVPGYCISAGIEGGEAINNVKFNTINNSSLRSNFGYHNYSNISTTVNKGSNYQLTVDISDKGSESKDEVYAWIDWNQDKDFDDAGESILLNKTTNLKGTKTIVIPSNAKKGNTIMRVKVAYYDTDNSPCGGAAYGEVEDYTLNIEGESDDDVIDPTLEYCVASGKQGPEAITSVNFAGINYTSVRSSLGYEDVTNGRSANLVLGSSSNLSVTITGYQGGANDKVYAWFDWNQDGDFDDAGEFIVLNKTSGTIGAAEINVPQNAVLGKTRMRLRVAYYPASAKPCGEKAFGEVEDYSVTISSLNRRGGITMVKNTVDVNKLTVYPNPLPQLSELNINFNSEEEGVVKVELYNVAGKKVFESTEEKTLERVKTIKIDKLPVGLYMLKTRIGEAKKSIITQIIIE